MHSGPCSIERNGTYYRKMVEAVFGVVVEEPVEEDGLMGMAESLKEEGYTPEANDDSSDFKPFKGTYKAVWDSVKGSKGQGESRQDVSLEDAALESVRVTFKVVETLEGDLADGRLLWKTFYVDSKNPKKSGIPALLNDAFTCGITLDMTDGNAGLARSIEDKLISAECFVRTWSWTPEKDREGNALAEEDRRALQQFIVKSEKQVKVTGESVSRQVAPF